MITIWKYEVEPDLVNQVYKMPSGAQIVSFGLDPQGAMCFWAIVDDTHTLEEHAVACIGTGWDANFGALALFVGSVTKGPYVWHLFDLGAGAWSKINKSAPTDSIEGGLAHE